MGNRVKLWVFLVLCFAVSAAMGKMEGGGRREKEKEEEERESSKESLFLLQNSKHVIKTDAGEMKVVKGYNSHGGSGIVERPMHIGFITMEPKSLFSPTIRLSLSISSSRTKFKAFRHQG